MILLALALAQTPVAAAPVTRAEHATAIGEQLKTWRASWRTRAGKTTCVTTRSSGDNRDRCGRLRVADGVRGPAYAARDRARP